MAHRRLHRNLSCRHFGSMSWSCAESSGTGSDWGRSESKSESSSQAPERRGSEGLNCVAACSGRSSVRIRRRRGGRMPRTKTWCGEDRRRVSLGARNYLRRGAAGTHLTTQKSPQASCTRLEPPPVAQLWRHSPVAIVIHPWFLPPSTSCEVGCTLLHIFVPARTLNS